MSNDHKTEIPGVYKVSEGILINKDKAALAAYKRNKKRMMTVDILEKEIDEVKSDLKEIKEILKGLVK